MRLTVPCSFRAAPFRPLAPHCSVFKFHTLYPDFHLCSLWRHHGIFVLLRLTGLHFGSRLHFSTHEWGALISHSVQQAVVEYMSHNDLIGRVAELYAKHSISTVLNAPA